MFCRTCGAPNDDSALKCASCGEALGPAPSARVAPTAQAAPTPGAKVSNHLVWAILATIFCCVPFGIVAIVYAAQVDGKAIAGDYAGAVTASNKAKTWCWVAFGVGIVGGLAYLALVLLGVFSGFFN